MKKYEITEEDFMDIDKAVFTSIRLLTEITKNNLNKLEKIHEIVNIYLSFLFMNLHENYSTISIEKSMEDIKIRCIQFKEYYFGGNSEKRIH